MKRLLLLLAFLCFTATSQAQTIKQATARIFESQSKELSRIVLVYETGESEIIELENFKMLASSSSTNEVLIENQKKINKLFNDMAEKGYEISKMTTTGEVFLYTFVVFTKKVDTLFEMGDD